MSSSSEDCTKRSNRDNNEAPLYMCTKKASDICLVVLSCVVFVIAALTVLIFCSAIGVLDMRLPWFSNHSSFDSQENTRVSGHCACDLEIDALRLQSSQTQAKCHETDLLVASLLDQKNEVSATIAKMNATETRMTEKYSAVLSEMTAVKLGSYNIYAKLNETSSLLSTWIAQVEAIKLNVSTIDEKGIQTEAKVSTLMDQTNALGVNVFKLNSTMTMLEQQISNLQSKMNEAASTVSALMTQRPSANSSSSGVTAFKSSAAAGVIVLLALLLQS